jgi:hypothetical protein
MHTGPRTVAYLPKKNSEGRKKIIINFDDIEDLERQ